MVKALEVVRAGVTPFPHTIAGEIGPDHRMIPAPLDAIPIEAKVAVPEPPVPVGKTMLETGLTALEVTVQPEPVRATATRA